MKSGIGEPEAVEHVELDGLTLPDPLALISREFDRIVIVGVGLIGGSIGLRMKAMEHGGSVIGCDRQEVLDEALARGAIDRGVVELSEAIGNADLIVLCVPVETSARLLPDILTRAKAGAIVTDTCPTKSELLRVAELTPSSAHYIGGHPLAGKDRTGIANADANLFENAYWLVTSRPDLPAESRETLFWWIRMLGAYPLPLEPDRHDQIVALTTHVPLMVALAMSHWLAMRSSTEPLLSKLATGSFQSSTALAALPPEMWEGALRSNQSALLAGLAELRRTLEEFEAAIAAGRVHDLWMSAAEFQRKLLRERPGDWDANCEISVTVSDRPGAIARIASLLATHRINIRDIGVLFVREGRGGSLHVTVESRLDARRAVEILKEDGFAARLRP
ncbi:prephenate dehydrogenase/arogenate dehydrogenase family protein [candidate division KSB1 bacterium]|nr:prephenate dehydrogenase/arogenate dehydrogenase family protein [candidate division KSB1 bacterium]